MSTVLPVITTGRSHNVKIDLIEETTTSLIEKIREEKKEKILGELEPCKPNSKKRKCDKGDKKKYQKLVAKLPTNYQDEYHKLIQYVAYYIIGMHFARRGREGKAFQMNYLKIFSVFFKGCFTLVD